MLDRMTWAALAASLALAGPAMAQTATGDTAETGETAVTGDDVAAEGGLSTGTEVSEGPKLGETYVVEKSGDWTVQCLRSEGDDPCQLYQLLKDASGNSVAEVSIFRLPPGGQVQAGATFIVPLETLLSATLKVSVDGGKAKQYPYSFCNQIGCYARVGLLAEDVNAYKRGAKATVTLVPFAAPDQTVSLTMSLTGFTAGLEKASVIAPRQ